MHAEGEIQTIEYGKIPTGSEKGEEIEEDNDEEAKEETEEIDG